MIYLMTFGISLIFISFGTQRVYKNEPSGSIVYIQKKRNVLITIGLLFPSILAGLRDASVGSDVSYYVVPYFKEACVSDNFFSYVKVIGGSNTDLAYDLMNFIISRLTDNIGWFFFLIEFFIMFFVFLGCWKMKEIAKPWKSMLFFYLFFYNMTLSTVRQSCACALVFYAMCILISGECSKKDIINTALCLIAAIFFHKTAIIAVMLSAFLYLNMNRKIDKKIVFFLCTIILIIFRNFQDSLISIILRGVQIISTKYTTIQFTGEGIAGSKCMLILCLFQIMMLFLLKKTANDAMKNNFADTMIFFNGIWIIIMLFLGQLSITLRMCYYIQFFWILGFSSLEKIKCNTIKDKIILQSGGIAIALFYWWYMFIYSNIYGTATFVIK